MQKITYTHTASGQSWDHKLPKILRYDGISTSNINEQNMAQFGIVKSIVEIPDPVPVEPILPAGVTSIESGAFRYCSSLADIVFLGTPNSIGTNVFFNTSANLFVPWSEGDVAGAPWGTNGIITYNYVA